MERTVRGSSRQGHADPDGRGPGRRGVNAGPAWVGAIGDDSHTELTPLLGDVVDTTARLRSGRPRRGPRHRLRRSGRRSDRLGSSLPATARARRRRPRMLLAVARGLRGGERASGNLDGGDPRPAGAGATAGLRRRASQQRDHPEESGPQPDRCGSPAWSAREGVDRDGIGGGARCRADGEDDELRAALFHGVVLREAGALRLLGISTGLCDRRVVLRADRRPAVAIRAERAGRPNRRRAGSDRGPAARRPRPGVPGTELRWTLLPRSPSSQRGARPWRDAPPQAVAWRRDEGSEDQDRAAVAVDAPALSMLRASRP